MKNNGFLLIKLLKVKINRFRPAYLPKLQPRPKEVRFTHENNPFYKTKEWTSIRKEVLNENPVCQYCLPSVVKSATVVDHLRPRRLWAELELDKSNLIPCCDTCHRRKSGYESNFKSRKTWERKMKGYLLKLNKL